MPVPACTMCTTQEGDLRFEYEYEYECGQNESEEELQLHPKIATLVISLLRMDW